MPPGGVRSVHYRPGLVPAPTPDGVVRGVVMRTTVATIPPAFAVFLGLGSDPGTGEEGVAPVSTRILVLTMSVARKMWNV